MAIHWSWKALCGPGNFTAWEHTDFSQCFELLAFSCSTHAILAIVSAYHISFDSHRRLRGPLPHSPTLWTRWLISLLLMITPLVAILLAFLYEKVHPSLIDIVSWGLKAVSWLLHSQFVWRLARLYHIHIRGPVKVVLSFLLTTGATAVEIHTSILHILHEDIASQITDYITIITGVFYCIYLLSLLPYRRPQLPADLLTSINSEVSSLLPADRQRGYGSTGTDELGVAEDHANCFSRLFFWWVQPLMVRGYKMGLSGADDLFSLPRQLETHNVEQKLLNVYKKHQLSQDLITQGETRSHGSMETSLPHVAVVGDGGSRLTHSSDSSPSANNHTAIGNSKENHTSQTLPLMSALNRAFGWEYYSLGLLKLVGDSLTFVGPLLLNHLVTYMEHSEEVTWHGYIYAAGLFSSTFLGAMFSTHFNYRVQVVALKVRGALITSIYRKTLVAQSISIATFNTGQVVNFMSTDTDRIVNFCPSFHAFWSLPLQIGVALYLLHQQVGLAFVAGLAFAVLLIPVNRWLAIKIGEISTAMMSQKDSRVKVMNEILFGIRVIKFYTWERFFISHIGDLRDAELKSLKSRKYLDALCVYFWATTPVLISILTFTTYVLLGHQLTAAKVFTSMALFNILIMPLNAFPWVLNGLMEAWVSISRLQSFMALRELQLDKYYRQNDEEESLAVGITDGLFSWRDTTDSSISEYCDIDLEETQSLLQENNDEERCDGDDRNPVHGTLLLQDINLSVHKGQLVGVIGSVGSGKSSLLNAILAEMGRQAGSVYVDQLASGFGYVSQESWIQHATFKDNILFGRSYDVDRYEDVLKACALYEDLKVLPAGDQTEIGENGVTLSGGQKARVSLARAVYQDKDIYLLDDPLSAVDAHVAKHLFDFCIMGLLKNKTRVLCTHHTSYLRQADHVIVMGHGRITAQGHPSAVMTDEMVAAPMKDTASGEDGDRESVKSGSDVSVMDGERGDGQLVKEEERDEGTVKVHVYMAYWAAIGSCLAPLILLSLFMMQASRNLSDWWLSYWVTHSISGSVNSTLPYTPIPGVTISWTRLSPGSDNLRYYLGVFGAFAAANSLFTFARAFLYAYGGFVAARTTHNKLLNSIMKAPVVFFDTTPIGRIMNRFSSDMYAIDDSLPFILNILLAQMYGLVGSLVVTSYGLPWFLLLLLPLGCFYYLIQRYYRRTSREIKRITSVTLSPIYAHFSETITGLTTVRAMRHSQRFQDDNRLHLEANQRAQFAGLAASQWLAIRLQMLAVLMVTGVAFIAVLEHHFHSVNAGLVGLAISYALSITNLLSGVVTSFTETEKQMVSVERASQYINDVPQEKQTSMLNVPSFWPIQGAVCFNSVCLRYRPGLPLALRDVSFDTRQAEKVGIVGRTGSGKSSLLLALFRMVELQEGQILIDGINISHLPLTELRSRLAIIPQDPFLFSGSVRHNLDPVGRYSDASLILALGRCHLLDAVEQLGGLNAELGERGRHFSMGQRQLLCLSRALLTRAKVLCIDEATASVDLPTDQLIQQTIREEFDQNTVITIAHRINTVMDCDRVLVMDAGKVAEFDPPHDLLQDRHSLFYSLVHTSH